MTEQEAIDYLRSKGMSDKDIASLDTILVPYGAEKWNAVSLATFHQKLEKSLSGITGVSTEVGIEMEGE